MSTGQTDPTTIADYRQSLILALRLKDVPGDRIGELVAEVESHVADTGEDPMAAFGPAKDYASTAAAGHRRTPWWQLTVIAVLAGTAGGLLAQGLLAILLAQQVWGQSGWLWLALGLLVGVPVAVHVQRSSSWVRDPRTGDNMVPRSRWGAFVLVGLPLGLVLLAYVAIRMLG